MIVAAKESYLALINNSIGSEMFRNRYFINDHSKVVDLTDNGNLSCAFYVSSILYLMKWSDLHITVASTIKEMEQSDLFVVVEKDFMPGDILLWSETIESNGHQHLGFFLGNSEAASNSPTERKIIKHHYTYEGKRPIVKAFRPIYNSEVQKSDALHDTTHMSS